MPARQYWCINTLAFAYFQNEKTSGNRDLPRQIHAWKKVFCSTIESIPVMPRKKVDDDNRSPRRLPARLPRHLRDAGHRRERRAIEVRGDPDHPTTAASCAPRWPAIPSASTTPSGCCIRCAASGPRARAGSSASAGTRRSTIIAARAEARSPRTGRRRSCPTATPARWACCSATRWIGALLPSAGRVAARPHHLRDRRRGGLSAHAGRHASAWTSSSSGSRATSSTGAATRASPTCISGRCAQEAKRRGANWSPSIPIAARRREKCHGGYRARCPGPMPRWRWA